MAEEKKNLHVPIWAAYGTETLCAVVSSFLVAPAISIIDKAIFSNASGKEPMVQSLKSSVAKAVGHPVTFLRSPSFLWIWLVYGGTYITANNIERFYERRGGDWFLPKFFGSSVANISLSVAKDRAFSRMYGVSAPKPLPAMSFALFATRDSMTIGASFNLPSVISKNLQTRGYSQKSADTIAQLLTPIGMQIFNTPLHLLGMDRYNNPGNDSQQRLAFIKREYLKTLMARWVRTSLISDTSVV